MRVQDVCSMKVVHIPVSCTLQEAAAQMRDRHVGALVVTEHVPAGGDRAVGLVTDRDIILNATAAGADPRQTDVTQAMSCGLITIDRDATIPDAVQTMLSHGIRRLAVLDGDAIVGILSLDDLLGALATDWGMLSSLIRNEQQRERSGSVQAPLHV